MIGQAAKLSRFISPSSISSAWSGLSHAAGALTGKVSMLSGAVIGAGAVSGVRTSAQYFTVEQGQYDIREQAAQKNFDGEANKIQAIADAYQLKLNRWEQGGLFDRIGMWFSAWLEGSSINEQLAEARAFIEGTEAQVQQFNEDGTPVLNADGSPVYETVLQPSRLAQANALNRANLDTEITNLEGSDPFGEATKVLASPTSIAMAGIGAVVGAKMLGRSGSAAAAADAAADVAGATNAAAGGSVRVAAAAADTAADAAKPGVLARVASRLPSGGRLGGIAKLAVAGASALGAGYLMTTPSTAEAATIDAPETGDVTVSASEAAAAPLEPSLAETAADVSTSIGVGVVAKAGLAAAGAAIFGTGAAVTAAVAVAADFAQAGVMTGVDAARGKDVSLTSFWDRTFTGAVVDGGSSLISAAFNGAEEPAAARVTAAAPERGLRGAIVAPV